MVKNYKTILAVIIPFAKRYLPVLIVILFDECIIQNYNPYL